MRNQGRMFRTKAKSRLNGRLRVSQWQPERFTPQASANVASLQEAAVSLAPERLTRTSPQSRNM